MRRASPKALGLQKSSGSRRAGVPDAQGQKEEGIARLRMREGGLEPPNLAAPDPKSGVSANSTTPAWGYSVTVERHSEFQAQ